MDFSTLDHFLFSTSDDIIEPVLLSTSSLTNSSHSEYSSASINTPLIDSSLFDISLDDPLPIDTSSINSPIPPYSKTARIPYVIAALLGRVTKYTQFPPLHLKNSKRRLTSTSFSIRHVNRITTNCEGWKEVAFSESSIPEHEPVEISDIDRNKRIRVAERLEDGKKYISVVKRQLATPTAMAKSFATVNGVNYIPPSALPGAYFRRRTLSRKNRRITPSHISVLPKIKDIPITIPRDEYPQDPPNQSSTFQSNAYPIPIKTIPAILSKPKIDNTFYSIEEFSSDDYLSNIDDIIPMDFPDDHIDLMIDKYLM